MFSTQAAALGREKHVAQGTHDAGIPGLFEVSQSVIEFKNCLEPSVQYP